MMIAAKSHSDATYGLPQIEKWLGQQLFRAIGPAPIRFVLKDGTEISPGGSSPVGTVFIHDNRTLAELMIDTEMAFGEAYAAGPYQCVWGPGSPAGKGYQSMAATPEVLFQVANRDRRAFVGHDPGTAFAFECKHPRHALENACNLFVEHELLDPGWERLRRFAEFPFSGSLQRLDGPSLVEVDDCIELI